MKAPLTIISVGTMKPLLYLKMTLSLKPPYMTMMMIKIKKIMITMMTITMIVTMGIKAAMMMKVSPLMCMKV